MTEDCAIMRRGAEALRREANALEKQARLLAAKDEVAAIRNLTSTRKPPHERVQHFAWRTALLRRSDHKS